MQEYYKTNKDKWNKKYLARGNEKVKCDVCDCYYRRKDRTRHERTKKHQKNLKEPKKDILEEYIKKLNQTLLNSGIKPPEISI